MAGLQNFIASMNKAKGFARTSKYAVVITPPTNLEQLASLRNTTTIAEGTPFQRSFDSGPSNPNASTMQDLSKQIGQQVNLHCNSISLPGHDLQAQDMQHGSAPGRQMVTSHDYSGTIAASFYLDIHMKERHFFEAWQKMAVDPVSHKVGYYDNYIGKMQIYQLGAEQAEDSRDRPTYAIEATEVYPKTISAIEYNYGTTNEIVKINVGFAYKQWYNMTTDPTSGRISSDIPFGTPRQRESAVKARNQGLFGFLPPELQRVGRNVINQGRTVFNPIGRIFGGKVFPPFT